MLLHPVCHGAAFLFDSAHHILDWIVVREVYYTTCNLSKKLIQLSHNEVSKSDRELLGLPKCSGKVVDLGFKEESLLGVILVLRLKYVTKEG